MNLRRFCHLFIILAIAVLTGCAQTQNFSKGSENIQLDEKTLGYQAASSLLSQAPLYRNEKTQQYVNRVGHHLAKHTVGGNINWRFAVIDDDSVNAFAAPDGYVFITSGMLNSLSSEAELAGVLAHEIVHVFDQHHLKAMRKKINFGLVHNVKSFVVNTTKVTLNAVEATPIVGDIVKGAETATSLALNTGEKIYSSIDQKQYLKKTVKGAINVATRLSTAIFDIYNSGLDRKDEFSADRKAVVISARSGYDPFAFITVLQLLESRTSDDTLLLKFFRTHPNIKDRLSNLKPVMEKLEYKIDANDSKQLAERYQDQII